MTNYERIRNMPVEELAYLLIEYDEERDMWWSSNCRRWDSEKEAIEQEIKWLLQESDKDLKGE